MFLINIFIIMGLLKSYSVLWILGCERIDNPCNGERWCRKIFNCELDYRGESGYCQCFPSNSSTHSVKVTTWRNIFMILIFKLWFCSQKIQGLWWFHEYDLDLHLILLIPQGLLREDMWMIRPSNWLKGPSYLRDKVFMWIIILYWNYSLCTILH